MTPFSCFRLAGILALGVGSLALGQNDPLVSKSISHLFAVGDKVFAIDENGAAFSRLGLFTDPPEVRNGKWPFSGGAEGGATWPSWGGNLRQSLLLRSNAWISDTTHSARVASLFYDGISWKSDSLILPLPQTSSPLARGAALTAMAVWHDTLVLGFGRLGFAVDSLASENNPRLFARNNVAFSGLPSLSNSFRPLISCAWNSVCRVDTVQVPATGLDSILDLAVDSSASDSIWLLVATATGLRRGLLGSGSFPRVSLPGIPDSVPVAVTRLASDPRRALLWVFTDAQFFFSDDHGASFRVPPALAGLLTTPSMLKGYATTPRAAFHGDSTFVNFNLDRPGLIVFRRDSLQRNLGTDTLGDVLLDSEDSLDIRRGEGSLSDLCVAVSGGAAVLAVGTTAKGILYRKLGGAARAFSNLNRLRVVKGALAEVITYPTLFTGETRNGQPQTVHLGYRLKKDGKVTITVFNYAMEKVRVLVRNAPRKGGGARSENPIEDQWDGRDARGRFVSVGAYYILVESDQGERGFGKALCARGRD